MPLNKHRKPLAYSSSIMSDISRECEELLVVKVLRVHQVQRAKKDTMDLEGKEDPRDYRDPLARPDHRVLRDPPGMESMLDGAGYRDQMKKAQAP